jgi:hypothetical protein
MTRPSRSNGIMDQISRSMEWFAKKLERIRSLSYTTRPSSTYMKKEESNTMSTMNRMSTTYASTRVGRSSVNFRSWAQKKMLMEMEKK